MVEMKVKFFYENNNKMESSVGLQMLQRFNRKRRNTDAMENSEGHFRLNYKETDAVTSLVTVAVKIVSSNKRKHKVTKQV